MKVFCILVSVVMLSQAAARKAATRQAPDDEYHSESNGYGMPYSFDYSVYHPPSYNDYGHQEASDGKRVDGEYRVALPDGRTQIVTYYVEGDSGFQAKVRYEPTVNGPPPSRPYEEPEPHDEVRRPAYEPVHEPRRPHYPPPYEPTHEPRQPHYPPPHGSPYRPREPEYLPAHLHRSPLNVANPADPVDSSIDSEEPTISTVTPLVIDEPQPVTPPISEGRKPHDGYSNNPSTKPYARPPTSYPPRPNPYPQDYASNVPREYPQPHDGYSPKKYKQFKGDYGKRVQPHDGYTTNPSRDASSPKSYNEPKEEYTPNLPHDGYSPKLYNEPKEEYPSKPYRHEGYSRPTFRGTTPEPRPPRIHEEHRPRTVPHTGYAKSNYLDEEHRSDLERKQTRPSHSHYHDGYTEIHPHRELKQSIEIAEKKPHTGYPDSRVADSGRPTSEKQRRSHSDRKVHQRSVQTNLRRISGVGNGRSRPSRVIRRTVKSRSRSVRNE